MRGGVSARFEQMVRLRVRRRAEVEGAHLSCSPSQKGSDVGYEAGPTQASIAKPARSQEGAIDELWMLRALFIADEGSTTRPNER
jgi:hypothetical protein